MNKIIISKLNNDENKIEWRISNSETGHYLNISISRALEDAMKKKNAQENLIDTVEQVFRVIKALK